jgi:hypothetical protein
VNTYEMAFHRMKETGMSQCAEVLRNRAREVTCRLASSDDAYVRALALTIAESYMSLARTEEWLEGEIPPVERSGIVPELRRNVPSE